MLFFYRRKALQKWEQKLGHDATYGKLASAFIKAGHQDYADKIYEIVGKLLRTTMVCTNLQITARSISKF
jgi:hypothetical protein